MATKNYSKRQSRKLVRRLTEVARVCNEYYVYGKVMRWSESNAEQRKAVYIDA